MYLVYFDPAIVAGFNPKEARKTYVNASNVAYFAIKAFKNETKLSAVSFQGYLYNRNILGDNIVDKNENCYRLTISLDKDSKKCVIDILDTKQRRRIKVLNIPFYNDYNKLYNFIFAILVKLFYVNDFIIIGDFNEIKNNVYVWRFSDKRRNNKWN